MPKFNDLPFYERPDLTPYLVHLTKRSKGKGKGKNRSAFYNLVNILRTGQLDGSDGETGFIKGPNRAACFMDVPFYSLKHVLNAANSDPEAPRYEPYGIFITKKVAYNRGARPVLYLSNAEVKQLGIPSAELWRVVRLDVSGSEWISWLHEREWRAKGDFQIPSTPHGVLVHNTEDAEDLRSILKRDGASFKVKPSSIIPLTVVCQGLIYL